MKMESHLKKVNVRIRVVVMVMIVWEFDLQLHVHSVQVYHLFFQLSIYIFIFNKISLILSDIDDQVCADLSDMSKYRYIVKITTITIMFIYSYHRCSWHRMTTTPPSPFLTFCLHIYFQ
jgi:hypothetical protein